MKGEYTIFIVFEGESTEPQYFAAIRDIIYNESYQEQIWTEGVTIDFSPEPKSGIESRGGGEQKSKYKTNRSTRNFRNVKLKSEERALPLKFVRVAQEALKSGAYDEAWAVFDHDNHPARKKAFDSAEKLIDGKKVRIAFSSIAFETWILMHFEQNATAFEKSACREQKEPLHCNSGIHPKDCLGQKCIWGYLRKQKYLPKDVDKSSNNLFSILEPNLNQAFINAAWLRAKMVDDPKKLYELNPYTDVDKLVAHLLKIHHDITWARPFEEIVTGGLGITFIEGEENLTIQLVNHQTISEIIPSGFLEFFEANESSTLGKRTVLQPRESFKLEVLIPKSPFRIRFKKENSIIYFGK